MSHFALITNGIVEQVIVAEQDFIDTLPNKESWIQTSYNTKGGIHYGQDGKPDGGTPLRKNYATIGGTYDSQRDAFIPEAPYPSWVVEETTCLWIAPIPKPNDSKIYVWDESIVNWKELEQPFTTGTQPA
jgi:hypothetical protein